MKQRWDEHKEEGRGIATYFEQQPKTLCILILYFNPTMLLTHTHILERKKKSCFPLPGAQAQIQ